MWAFKVWCFVELTDDATFYHSDRVSAWQQKKCYVATGTIPLMIFFLFLRPPTTSPVLSVSLLSFPNKEKDLSLSQGEKKKEKNLTAERAQIFTLGSHPASIHQCFNLQSVSVKCIFSFEDSLDSWALLRALSRCGGCGGCGACSDPSISLFMCENS